MDLKNYFLISTESTGKSIFSNAIVYICRHGDEGALGVVINKPSDTSVSELLDRLLPEPLNSGSRFRSAQRVVNGGPVHPEQILVLHSPVPPDSPDEDSTLYDMTIRVSDDVYVTTSKDIIAAIHKGETSEAKVPEKMLLAFGHARWAEGQLEEEIMENTWITIPARADILFDTPVESRLSAATTSLGFNINQLSCFAGNA